MFILATYSSQKWNSAGWFLSKLLPSSSQTPEPEPKSSAIDAIFLYETWDTALQLDISTPVKSMVFAMEWKGEVQADLEQAQTHKHQHQI